MKYCHQCCKIDHSNDECWSTRVLREPERADAPTGFVACPTTLKGPPTSKTLLASLAAAALLSGCGSIPDGTFSNRISRTLDCKAMYVNSMYGPIGLTSKVAAEDNAAVPCVTPAAAAAPPFREPASAAVVVPAGAAGAPSAASLPLVK